MTKNGNKMKIVTAERMRGIEEYSLAKAIRQVEKESAREEIISLAVGDPDLRPPKKVIEALTFNVKEEKSHNYQPSVGSSVFRNEAVKWYKRVFSVSLDQSEVISLIGSKEGIFHLSLALLNKGDNVMVPDPGYPIYRCCASLLQAGVITYNLTAANEWQIDISELEKKYTGKVKIIWLNSPNMPTGSILKKKNMEEVINFASKNKILVVHDNPYSFILNKDKPFSVLSVKGARENAVELCSLSKTFNIPGFRTAIAAGNKEALEAIIKTKSIIDSGSYLPVQTGAARALTLGKRWYKEQNSIYSKRKEEVIKLAKLLNCTVEGSSAGMFLWARLPGKTDDKKFIKRLFDKTQILVTPGSLYGNNGKGYIRISLCLPDEKIKVAQERIKKQKAGSACL
jgi:aspartate/methionine/tyrosine aminotransferase